MRAVFIAAAVAAVPMAAFADLSGPVVRVNDGETITIRVDKRHVRVRLESIDAPERKQPFWKQSRQSLSEMCAKKTATVREAGKGQSGLVRGWVTCDGIDANTEQVRRGMAWVSKGYAPLGSPLLEAEAYARLRQVGLWADPHPVAPWDYRNRDRKAKAKGPGR